MERGHLWTYTILTDGVWNMYTGNLSLFCGLHVDDDCWLDGGKGPFWGWAFFLFFFMSICFSVCLVCLTVCLTVCLYVQWHWTSAQNWCSCWVIFLSSSYVPLTKIPPPFRTKESFNNYVDNILLFFDHLPTSKWILFNLNLDKNINFFTTFLPHFVQVVFERPLSSIFPDCALGFLQLWRCLSTIKNQ